MGTDLIGRPARAVGAIALHAVFGVAAVAAVAGVDHVALGALHAGAAFRADVGGAIALGGVVAAMEVSAQSGDDPELTRGADKLLAAATGLALAAIMSLAPALRLASPAAPSLASWSLGACLVLAGGALRARSIRALGAAFVTDPKAAVAKLVERDVYAQLRHPSELGLLLIAAGMSFVCPGPVAIAGALAIGALAWARLRREERALRRSLGAAYEAYASRVPALVPLLRPRPR
jgi:protein-S-isoprenylcysteine O-methyltransferase Ste14